jgi:GR25 family glycosyltransferase involved in LPS biosynthesis
MRVYLISSAHESTRQSNIEAIHKNCPFPVQDVEAIYPAHGRVPFMDKLLKLSKDRTGHALLLGELGCLLSHRKAWKKALQELENEKDHVLIMESDSKLLDAAAINDYCDKAMQSYDLFFWGAWEGHMKFFKSKKERISASYTMGEPFIRTVYCTYGYSLNKKAARLLLDRTSKIGFPVDQFKYFFSQEVLRLGGILPEVITGNAIGSTIREKENQLVKKLFLAVLDIKNNLICSLR